MLVRFGTAAEVVAVEGRATVGDLPVMMEESVGWPKMIGDFRNAGHANGIFGDTMSTLAECSGAMGSETLGLFSEAREASVTSLSSRFRFPTPVVCVLFSCTCFLRTANPISALNFPYTFGPLYEASESQKSRLRSLVRPIQISLAMTAYCVAMPSDSLVGGKTNGWINSSAMAAADSMALAGQEWVSLKSDPREDKTEGIDGALA